MAALLASVLPPGVPAESATNFGASIVSELNVAVTSAGTVAPGIAMLGQMQLQGGDTRGLADTLIMRTLTHAGELDAFATL